MRAAEVNYHRVRAHACKDLADSAHGKQYLGAAYLSSCECARAELHAALIGHDVLKELRLAAHCCYQTYHL